MKSFEPVDAQVASNRTPRHINSKVVLDIIRRRQPLSRADLARISSLRPSTISLIIDELIEAGWVLEGEIADSPRGRRPTLISLNPQRCVIALDIHPAQSTIAIVDISGQIVSQRLIALPAKPAAAVTTIVQAIRALIDSAEHSIFEGIGICVPGRIDPDAQRVVFAPNLEWSAVSLKSRIERATGFSVVMDNVANACALSEVWFGDYPAGRDFVVVNVSEGIGTGVFINGSIARGENGMAGEFGHIQMMEDGLLCNCGSSGCWETLASNRAAVRLYQELSGARKPVSFPSLLRLAESGDTSAARAFESIARELARGFRLIATALAPSEIIVVGEITRVWHLISNVIETTVRSGAVSTVRIRPAYDSKTARLQSAAALVMTSHAFSGSGAL